MIRAAFERIANVATWLMAGALVAGYARRAGAIVLFGSAADRADDVAARMDVEEVVRTDHGVVLIPRD